MGFIPTFAEYRGSFGLPDAPGLTEDERVTILWSQYDQAVWQRVTEIEADPIAGANLRALFDVISEEIINSHLGGGWFAEHVDRSGMSDRARNYLHFEGPPQLRLLSAHRVHELARRLYQLQSFPWFHRVLANIRTRDLPGAGFELDVLVVLHMLIALVTPQPESGRKGQDYDIRLRMGGIDVPIEVKAKDDGTEFSPKDHHQHGEGSSKSATEGRQGIRVPADPELLGRSTTRGRVRRRACGGDSPDQPRRRSDHRNRQNAPQCGRYGWARDKASSFLPPARMPRCVLGRLSPPQGSP